MSEKKQHKHADVIIAWANGETIECRNDACSKWVTFSSGQTPNWYEDIEYRVKPKMVDKWRWVTFDGIAYSVTGFYYSEIEINIANSDPNKRWSYIQKIDSTKTTVQE